MVFSSMFFLSAFLPITFVVSLLLPKIKQKNIWLILVSLLFYAYGEPIYVLLMIGSVLVNNVLGNLIVIKPRWDRIWIALCVIFNIGILVFFKYTPMIVQTINRGFHLNIEIPAITMPIGISFFTFQAMSYVIDTYRNQQREKTSFLNALLYVSFFPQLIAGPIVKYHDIHKEINNRHATAQDIGEGIRRFIIGLAKKVLIANTAAQMVDTIYGLPETQINIVLAWIASFAYVLQIYFDFSGYSDMAIGLGRMFGFHFKENFNYPYGAVSVQEFWRKWHISLSTWFKEYVYIPLGGNRKGKVRTYLNRYIVFFLTGLWHGADWSFVVWGLLHGTLLTIENTRYFSIQKIKKNWLKRIYMFVVVNVTFVIFRGETLAQGFFIIQKMFVTGFSFSAIDKVSVMGVLTPLNICILIIGAVLAIPNLKNRLEKSKWFVPISYAGSIGLLLLVMISLASNAYNPFIYFRF